MPIFVRQADTWKPRAGQLFWVRVNNTWRPVAFIYRRMGDAWAKENTYVGLPTQPNNLRITSAINNYSTVDIAWDPPSGGAPAVTYYVQMFDSGGSSYGVWNTNGATSIGGFGVNWDWSYRWLVWAVGAGGAQSATYAEVRYHIGHPQQIGQHYVDVTVGYDSGAVGVSLKKDQVGGPTVPPNATPNTIIVHVKTGNGATGATTSGAMQTDTRQLYWVRNGGQAEQVGPLWSPPSPWDASYGWGTGGLSGLVPRGTGWSVTGTTYMVLGTIQVTGTQVVQQLQNYVIANEQYNSYW